MKLFKKGMDGTNKKKNAIAKRSGKSRSSAPAVAGNITLTKQKMEIWS